MITNVSNINNAAIRIKPYIHRTPVLTSQSINQILGGDFYFKCENFQKTGAFKFRGASNAIFSISADDLKNGVATHSSGNHAAALSLAARNRNTKAFIVMPEDSSAIKIKAVKSYGGIITFCEPTLQSREDTLSKIISETNAIEIHPYNNYPIICGQATAAKELIEDFPHLDVIIAPVGGGGLLSGTALATHYYSPGTKVIAAEPEQANDAFHSFYQKKFIPSVSPQTIADGLRTSLGSLTFPIIQKYVTQIVTVSELSIIQAMRLVWERMKIIIEPSSAVPIAALLENKFDYKGQKIGIILSGGNVDLEKLPWIL